MPSRGSHPRYSDRVRSLIKSNISAGVRTRDIAEGDETFGLDSIETSSVVRGVWNSVATIP
jgi:hypothetical protein